MNHTFQPSLNDSSECLTCHKSLILHTDMAECEACPTIGPVDIFGDMALCQTCIQKEIKTSLEYQSPELQSQRLAEYKLKIAEQIDNAVQYRSDIFNAQTVSIHELKKTIDEDDTVINKHYILAEALKKRYEHFSEVIKARESENVDDHNRQRSIQTYLNDLATRLREDEKAKLRLQDISYIPTAKPVKARAISKSKNRTIEINEFIKKLTNPMPGLDVILNVVCMQRNCSVEAAYNIFTQNESSTNKSK